MSAIIQCNNLYKTYENENLEVLKNINFSIEAGEKIAIIGPSGSGKSTLLHLLGGLDVPSKGKVYYNNIAWYDINESERCKLRNKSLGFIYQFHHLLPELTALENTIIPLLFAEESMQSAKEKAYDLLCKVGLKERVTHKPSQLSGGERQRVAIARALVNNPTCILADEPTGNLDSNNARQMLELLLTKIDNTALILVTHDQGLASKMDKVVVLKDGELDYL